MGSFCGDGNETSVSVKCGEFGGKTSKVDAICRI